MNYQEIIFKGYLNDDNRSNLINYFVREYKKAERDNFIDYTEFFSGLERRIRKIKGEVNSKLNKRKSELNFMVKAAQNQTLTYTNPDPERTIEELHDETITNCTREIELLDLNDFSFNIEIGQDTGFNLCLGYQHIELIERAILEAKSIVTLNHLDVDGNDNLPKPLKTRLTSEKGSILYDWLITNKFMSENADKGSFLWIFAGTNKPQNFYPIEWKKSKQLLRELLIPLRFDMTVAEVERTAPLNFIKYDKPLKLSKPKGVLSKDSDNLKIFLATL